MCKISSRSCTSLSSIQIEWSTNFSRVNKIQVYWGILLGENFEVLENKGLQLMFSRGHNRWIVTPYQQNLDNTTFITTFNYLTRQQYIPFRKYSHNLTLECMAQPVKRRVTNYWKKFLFISGQIGSFLIIFYWWKFPFISLCF